MPNEFLTRFGRCLNFFGELFDLRPRRFAARFRSGEFVFECRDSAFGFGKRQLQFLEPRAPLGAIFLDFRSETVQSGQLAFLFFQVPLNFCDPVIGLLDLSGVLFAFLSSLGHLAPGALDQFGDLVRALSIELNAATVRSDFTFQLLYFRARTSYLDVDLVQHSPFFCDGIFAVVDLHARRVLGFGEMLDLFVASAEISFERIELLARIMRLQHAQVRMQRLVSPRFACLSLQRTNLSLYLFDDVANAQEIRFRRFQFAQRFALLRFVFCDSGRFLKNCAPIFRPRAQDHVDLALLHHRVSGPRDARVCEKTLNVAKTARRFV